MVSHMQTNSPYRLIYKGFRAAGIVNQEGRPWSIIYSIYHVVMMNIFGVTAVLAVLWGNGNLTELILSISSLSIYAQIIVKQFFVLTNETNIKEFLKRMENYREKVIQDKERMNVVIEAEKFSIKFITFYTAFFIGFPFISIIMNFYIDYLSDFKSPHLVFQLYIPWKMDKVWPYIAGNIYTAVALMSAIVTYLSFTILEFIVTFQMSAYLRVLQNRIETNGPRDKYIYYHHKTIIQLLREYNKLFSGTMYQEVIVSALHPCGYGYALIKAVKSNGSGSFDMIYKAMMAFSGPFILCACGEEINHQVEKLHESSYSCKWYEEKPKVRRDIFTMMLVTIRPITVNYRLFVTLNLQCFSTITKGFYSYLTMIINFDEN